LDKKQKKMKKPILFALVTFVLILFAVESSPAQNSSSYPLWNGIEAGPHPVGFQVINYQDESRTPSDTTSDVNFSPFKYQYGIRPITNGLPKKQCLLKNTSI